LVSRPYEQRHVRAANEVASRTPPEAIVLSVQHSGSVRYYANRTTLRYDWLEESALDGVLRDLAAKGRRAYLVVDDWEEKRIPRSLLAGQPRRAPGLAPIARVPGKPGSAHFRLAGRRSCSRPMKKAALAFAVYCAITLALTYPLILQMGSVLPNDAGDPALNTWILWWEHAVDAVFEMRGGTRPRFTPAPGRVEFFGEPARPESCIATPLQWLGADRRRPTTSCFFDVPSQRAWRVPARVTS
jgi:hypothetical protein